MILFFLGKTIRHYVHIINPRKFNWRNLPVSLPVSVSMDTDRDMDVDVGRWTQTGTWMWTWTWADPETFCYKEMFCYGDVLLRRRFVKETFCRRDVL